jgi:hypothetical protein
MEEFPVLLETLAVSHDCAGRGTAQSDMKLSCETMAQSDYPDRYSHIHPHYEAWPVAVDRASLL